MTSRKDCVDGIAARTGRDPKDVEDDLKDMLDRADQYEAQGMDYQEALSRAGLEIQEEHAQKAALMKRAAVMDARKDYTRRRDYRVAQAEIARIAPKLAAQAAHLALESKLVGVNLPFFKNRHSVDAQYVALRRMTIGGFAHDLEKSDKGDLLKLFGSRQLEKEWAAELFELWKGKDGKPGVSRNPQALEIARAIQKWQRQSMDMINREGSWVRSYSGYITKTSHDADAILRAGPEKWIYETIGKLDLKRTFGTTDRQRALDALRYMWSPMANGDHFDYGRPVDEPLFANLARKAAASRELHFKTAADWLAYNEAYGLHNPTLTVVQAFSVNSRRLALMKEFGTRPAAAFDADVAHLKALQQAEMAHLTSRLKVSEAFGQAEIEKMEADAKLAAAKFRDFESWEGPLRNRFAQIDGSSMRPVNRVMANVVSGWMATQRMAKLGNVALTHFASLPTKMGEARYWNVSFGERLGSLFRGLTSGAAGSNKRQVLEMTLLGVESRLGHIMSMYDVADAPHGALAQMETTYFKLTGVSAVLDNQRGDAEAMFAGKVGSMRGQAWGGIGHKERRVLGGFGIGENEWTTLHKAEWTKVGERTFLFPSDAKKLSDADMRAYLERKPGAAREPSLDEIAKARDDLALSIATAYTDRAGFAIPMPDARTRAMMFRKNFEPGTIENTALRLLYQFKMWPATMITRAWGREIYGTVGDSKMDRIAGLVEMAIGAFVFGTASEVIRQEIKGLDGVAHLIAHPLAAMLAGAQRSGMGTLLGDFLLGEFDRHDLSGVASLAGPTFSQLDILLDLIHAGGQTNRHPWRTRAADTIKLVRDNAPFMNLWMTNTALNYLIWWRLQDWINPGYLDRMEERMRKNQGMTFWLSPQGAAH